MGLETIIKFNNLYRKNKIRMIYTSCLGLSGFVFNEFGEEHIIFNIKGDEPQKFFVKI